MGGSNDIFILSPSVHTEGQIVTPLQLNKKSEIFEGHFPGQPVVPGACMLQLVKNVLQANLGNSIQLKRAGNLKFISMIIPEENQDLSLIISYKPTGDDQFAVTAKLTEADKICFKFQGVFVKM